MGTASTMAILTEALGLMLPGSSSVAAEDPRRVPLAWDAGARAVELVREELTPSLILTPAAFRNAIRVLHAIGGSTNAVIHLAAIAGRVGVPFELDDVSRYGADVPLLADVEPSGAGLMQDLDAGGGLPALMRAIAPLLERSARTITGAPLADVLDAAPEPSGAIRTADRPLREGGAFATVRGTLAPDGALVKTSAATPELLKHRGRAIVFRSYEEMRRRVEDPALDADADSVLVLSGCGPVGAGMPEWGMVPIPRKLAEARVHDMVRVTDARMSGTSFGTVFLHVAPEAAIGGPLSLVEDGDPITVDVEAGRIDLGVDDHELQRRSARWTAPPSPHLRGWPVLYREHVMQAPDGCDLDFLRAPTPAHRRLVEPVVGRS
jgi:dihydroxy-acid dehydratase